VARGPLSPAVLSWAGLLEQTRGRLGPRGVFPVQSHCISSVSLDMRDAVLMVPAADTASWHDHRLWCLQKGSGRLVQASVRMLWLPPAREQNPSTWNWPFAMDKEHSSHKSFSGKNDKE
jgi:hypothetical protein